MFKMYIYSLMPFFSTIHCATELEIVIYIEVMFIKKADGMRLLFFI